VVQICIRGIVHSSFFAQSVPHKDKDDITGSNYGDPAHDAFRAAAATTGKEKRFS